MSQYASAPVGMLDVHAAPGLRETLRNTWRLRHFSWTYAQSRIIAARSENRLGLLWEFISPMLLAGVYYLAFGVVLGTRRDNVNFEVFLLIGVFTWQLMNSCLMGTAECLVRSAKLVKSVHFTRLALPVSVTMRELLSYIPMLAVIVAVALITGEPVRVQWLLILAAMAVTTLFGTGIGLLLAHPSRTSRDISQLLPVTMRAWMFMSGVFYDPAVRFAKVDGWLGWLLEYNPGALVLETARSAFLPSIAVDPTKWLAITGLSITVAVLGVIVFAHRDGKRD